MTCVANVLFWLIWLAWGEQKFLLNVVRKWPCLPLWVALSICCLRNSAHPHTIKILHYILSENLKPWWSHSALNHLELMFVPGTRYRYIAVSTWQPLVPVMRFVQHSFPPRTPRSSVVDQVSSNTWRCCRGLSTTWLSLCECHLTWLLSFILRFVSKASFFCILLECLCPCPFVSRGLLESGFIF